MSPYLIEGPAVISFSGGRTSGYMLKHILDAHDGALPEDVEVVFANTGKERPETLDFVRDCEQNWNLSIVGVEYAVKGRSHAFKEVNHRTASRNGGPFDLMIEKKKILPNPTQRFCTTELKIKPMQRLAKARGWKHFTNVIGLRADEPRRVARARQRGESGKDDWDVATPLAVAGVSKHVVKTWWGERNFNLNLPDIGGVTPAGNCDLCFLKTAANLSGLMRDYPGSSAWWMEKEQALEPTRGRAGLFRADRPSYAALQDAVDRQEDFDFGDADALGDCFCHD
ncbi:3'-phosphoadenosine 5'-phosphosulfate sulfotransferase [Candidatus Pacearchaeota archaeon]|nr:3'-phosphoadenosine 5'-phosphosulfate sulfotransferase [Candidatus Pacearchaeota archaeon]